MDWRTRTVSMERSPSPRKKDPRTVYKEHWIGLFFVGFCFFPPYKTSKYKNLKTPSKAERDVENLNGHVEMRIKNPPK